MGSASLVNSCAILQSIVPSELQEYPEEFCTDFLLFQPAACEAGKPANRHVESIPER
jgi:hypothetical protein